MNHSLKSPSRYSPAERTISAHIREEHLLFAASDVAAPILNAMSEPAAILNEDRRLVYANFAFLQAARIDSNESLLGLCLGELFGCVHVVDAMAGHGTYSSCQTCGTMNAPLTPFNGEPNVSTVDIMVADGDEERRMQFHRTTPIVIRGKCFSLIRMESL